MGISDWRNLAIPAIAFTWYKTRDIRIAALCTIAMLSLMMVTVIFAKAAGQKTSMSYWPAIIFTWFCLLLFIAVACSLFGSIFFDPPHLDWSFITKLRPRKQRLETPPEGLAAKDEAAGDTLAAGAISNQYCYWHLECPNAHDSMLPPRIHANWASAKFYWNQALKRS